ncbi:unnamed protein product [Sphagnum jensenii]
MAGSFQWITLNQGIAQLAARLSDTSMVFWTQAELQLYLTRALQQFNVLTNTWRTDFQFTSPNLWNSLGSLAGSPRLRTSTDAQSYTMLQYYLLEPPTAAGTWTGTTQFSLSDLVTALQNRRNEVLQITASNDVLVQNIPLTPNVRRTYLPDNTLDCVRVRYLALQCSPTATGTNNTYIINVSSASGIATGLLVSGTGIANWATVSSVVGTVVTLSLPNMGTVTGIVKFYLPNTLYRDDTVALEWYESPLYQLPAGTPQTFQLSSEPPLSFDVDITPAQPGVYEAIVSQSGPAFNPPNATVMGTPNDWSFILEYGALADLLAKEPESSDPERAAYCAKRYLDYLGVIKKTPWIMLGNVNGVACSVDSLEDTDIFSVGWDQAPKSFGPVIVTAGIDTIAAPVGSSIGCTVLGNAPILDSTGVYLQVSRDQFQTVLDLAQALSVFKCGGQDWKQCLELEERAIKFAAAENSRLKSLGSFSDILMDRGQAQDRSQQRFSSKKDQQ